MRRSSYAALGVLGLALGTGHFSDTNALGIVFGAGSPTTWPGPVAYLCLGLFIVALGMLLQRRHAEPGSA
jgi:hypothetical protein